jgi:hypothetical protein
MRLFHGARQGTQSAAANQAPGIVDPANPSRTAKSPANRDFVTVAAASMHDDLAQEARRLANGNENVPVHPAQLPSEGDDTGETEGDSDTRSGAFVVKTPKPRGTPG